MKFLDTNIILRYLTLDNPSKAQKCESLFQRVAAGREVLFTSTLVIAEVVWVLEKAYKLSKTEIGGLVQKILNTPHIECDEKDVLMAAAGLYGIKNIDFIDAYNAILMQVKKIETIYSYDTDFDSLPPLKRLEP
ncbi:MAG: PIN domain-containing protein [Candidatus Omnitrophica bacterium]|nr:PIN domain-containing protein [Candidatus Omnitrophota bacterium]